MKIIKDEEQQLNLNPFVIYVVLSSKNYTEKTDYINLLNKKNDLTQGMFKFQPIRRTGNYSTAVSTELTDSIKNYNMIVRLMDDNSGCFYYAVQKVTFDQDGEDLEKSIERFIANVCNKNVEQLNLYIKNSSSEDKICKEKGMTIIKLQNVFRNALEVLALNQNNDSGFNTRQGSKISDSNQWEIPEKIPEEVKKAVTDDNIEKIRSWLESIYVPDEETSDDIANGYFDGSNDKRLRREKFERSKPKTEPNIISIEIKKLTSRILKSGAEKKKYGIVFNIENESIEVLFESKDQTMVYICTLLQRKKRKKMYKNTFLKGTPDRWIKEVSSIIFKGESFDFDDWIEKLQKDSGDRLNKGKSRANNCIIRSMLSFESSIYYCTLKTDSDENGKTYYDVYINPDIINIPIELEGLIELPSQRVLE